MFIKFAVKIQFRTTICGGIPRADDILSYWLKKRYEDEIDAAKRKEEIQAQIDELGGDLPAELEERNWNTFLRQDNICCIADYQIKAMMKESANILKLTKHVKGLKNAISNGVFIAPQLIPLHIDGKPANVMDCIPHEVCGTVIGPAGPRSIISRYDSLLKPTAEFTLKVTEPLFGSEMVIEEKYLRAIWQHGEESGLGSLRNRGNGTFDLVSMNRI